MVQIMVSRITSRIYVGNSKGAKDEKFFNAIGIDAVLNCTTDIPNYFCETAEYLRIPVEDSLKKYDIDLMYAYLPVISEFIHKIVDIEKKTIYIHCWAGMQRSTAALCAYFIRFHGKTIDECRRFIVSNRAKAFHYDKNINFRNALEKYYYDVNKL